MKIIKFLSVALLSMICVCCNNKNYSSEISKAIKNNLNDLKLYDMIVVLPGSGCTGCINGAERFFLENVGNEKIKFILTYNTSKKNLFLRLGKDNVTQQNVFIDDKDIFYLNGCQERIYPMAIILEDGEIVKVDMLDNLPIKQ